MSILRRISVNVANLVRNELPAHLRSFPTLLAFGRGLLAPFATIADEWKAAREGWITRAKVTAETASLQWYLNALFDTSLQRIYIETAGLSGKSAGIEATEPAKYFVAGIEGSEPTLYSVIGLKGEDTGFLNNAFMVFVPTALSAQSAAILAVVRQYALAGKNYTIKLF